MSPVMPITRDDRAGIKGQRPLVIWLTGLSGAGKSTIADLVEARLHGSGYHTYLLDGDIVRAGLCSDLTFSKEHRAENLRRVGEVARMMVDAGIIVIAAFISPFEAERKMVREMFAVDEFVEIFVDTPIEEAERRDVKGLYRRARAGEIPEFTGIDSPYEPPSAPEITIRTLQTSAEAAADFIVAYIADTSSRPATPATPPIRIV